MSQTGRAATVSRRAQLWFQYFPEKELAYRFGVSDRTARSWRNGALPSAEKLFEMMAEWGGPFHDWITQTTAPSLAAEAEAVRILSENLQKRVRDAERRLESGKGSSGGAGAFGGVFGRDAFMLVDKSVADSRRLRRESAAQLELNIGGVTR